MSRYDFNVEEVVNHLNQILEAELSGVIKYTHYSFMIFGPHRIPIIDWLRANATESMLHATQIGELITHLGGHPSLEIGDLLETYKHDTVYILKECLVHEENALNLYRGLLKLVQDKSVMIEEFARQQISEEEKHCGEVEKMIGEPGRIQVPAGAV